MQTIKIELEGLTPLLTNNVDNSDPLGVYSKKLKSLTSNRKKTDEDHQIISRVSWEASLYLHNGAIELPSRIFKRVIILGGKENKQGRKLDQAVLVDEPYIPLFYTGQGPMIQGIPRRPEDQGDIPLKELDQYFGKYLDRRVGTRNKQKVWISRGIFENWTLSFNLLYKESLVNERDIVKAIQIAGERIGICENNIDNFGRFKVL